MHHGIETAEWYSIMVFSSLSFLYYFLPAVVLVYYLVKGRARNYVLLAFSIFFYFWGEQKLIVFMLLSIVLAYLAGLLIEKNYHRRMVLIAFCVYMLGQLGYFKYLGLFGFSIKVVLPIGISFYTFQALGYVIDVYRGLPAQKNLFDLALYIAMFPQLIAGPIVRYKDIADQLDSRTPDWQNGVLLFMRGLAKKVLMANNLGSLVALAKASGEQSVLLNWLYALAFFLQIYYDFSGYSDMAIGLGKLFGFNFLTNFDYPYSSQSITEFWRRWHISLGNWFRDYVYIPLGGNRCSLGRHLFNIFFVWMLTGLWHGANWHFVWWGLYFGVLLVLEKYVYGRYLKGFVAHLYVLLAVLLGFVLFDGEAARIPSLFGFGQLALYDRFALFQLRNYGFLLLIALALSFKYHYSLKPWQKYALAAAGLLVCTAYLVDGSFNPFLYFRF